MSVKERIKGAKENKKIIKLLSEVMDPELHISLVDLGLIYEIKKMDKGVKIVMTLTTIGCPLFPLIKKSIEDKLNEAGIKNVEVELTFDPPWTLDRVSDSTRALLGF